MQFNERTAQLGSGQARAPQQPTKDSAPAAEAAHRHDKHRRRAETVLDEMGRAAPDAPTDPKLIMDARRKAYREEQFLPEVRRGVL